MKKNNIGFDICKPFKPNIGKKNMDEKLSHEEFHPNCGCKFESPKIIFSDIKLIIYGK